MKAIWLHFWDSLEIICPMFLAALFGDSSRIAIAAHLWFGIR
jgi:hypothetical protein